MALQQHSTDSDLRRVRVDGERLFKIGMRKSRCCTQAALNLFERFDVLSFEFDGVVTFSRGSKLVERRSKFGCIRDEIAIEVHETEKRLHLADSRGKRPVSENAQLRWIGGTAGGRDDVAEIQYLIAE